MTLKVITCPQCGKILCKATHGSQFQIFCHGCKTTISGKVDSEGGVYALPIVTKSKVSQAIAK